MLMNSLCLLFFLFLSGCAAKIEPVPADRVQHETWHYDCCDPGLSSGTKDMCKYAQESATHTLIDNDGNQYKFIWSDCEIGQEPWRRFE